MVLLLLLLVPVVELFVLIWVGTEIGALNTIALLIAVSVVGVWVVKLAGLGLVRRMQTQMAQGVTPSDEIVEGLLLLLAGVLLLIPGFLTDIVAVVLILPPVRSHLARRWRRQLTVRVARYGGPGSSSRGGTGPVYDVGSRDLDP